MKTKLKIANITTAVATAFCFTAFSKAAFSFEITDKSLEWTAFERDATPSRYQSSSIAQKIFAEFTTQLTSTTRDIRMMIEGSEDFDTSTVESLQSTVEIDADQWLAGLPAEKKSPTKQTVLQENHSRSECTFSAAAGAYECEMISSSTLGLHDVKNLGAQILVVAPSQPTSQDDASELSEPVHFEPSQTTDKLAPSDDAPKNVKLYRGAAGVVTTEGGKILFNRENTSLQLTLSPEVKRGHVSMFVRDPAVVTIDLVTNQMRSHTEGKTEIFVVSRDRISIIPVQVGMDVNDLLTVNAAKSKTMSPPNKKSNEPTNLGVPENLASLDSLDLAATSTARASIAANVSSPETLSPKDPEDLTVPDEVAVMNSDLSKQVTFVRAKAKASFNRLYLRIIDERSSWNLTQVFPVGGLRVKLIGTEFEAKSDSQGYAEIPDVPIGSRILVEIIDNTGSTMPAFMEVVADPSSSKKFEAQTVMVRRYISLDYAARLAGVVQNMQLSSLCGTIVDSSQHRQPRSGARVAIKSQAIGPFYFNDTGYLDTRMGSTGKGGRFCYFNVTPGAVTLAVTDAIGGDSPTANAVVLLTATGRHTEDIIAVNDARHVTTSIASVPTASEQLSSSSDLSNKYLAVEHADLSSIGYEDPMISIDEGVFTTSTPIIPVRGRVWTVSDSSDFELSVQATSIRLPGSRQITSLLPRGFVDDMTNYAQTNQDHDNGVIVIEHAALAGQGSESVKIRLVDAMGKDAGEGWYFADLPVAKAVFFNVPPGIYSVVVETSGGQWLAADTALSYEDTSTFVRTGAPLEKHMLKASASNAP